MSIQKYILKFPKFTRLLLENLPSEIFFKLGEMRAYNSFKEATKTKAYKKFLSENKIEVKKIKSFKEFERLPIMDKRNYIEKYDYQDLLKYKLEDNYTIESSGGYSGKSYYWARHVGQDDSLVNYINLGMDKIFKINSRSTLFINAFALGTWTTGVKVARSMLQLANQKAIKMTVINTGTSMIDVKEAIKRLSKYYDQVIVSGYPPFLKELVNFLVEEKVQLPPIFNIISGGEGFIEPWRDNIAKLLKFKIEEFKSVIASAYGSADTGLEIGYEQPVTILLRRVLHKNKKYLKQLIGEDSDFVPHFFQFNPLSIWIETINKELVFTSDSGIPIVRYNLHDRGGIIYYDDMIKFLSSFLDVEKLKKELRPFHLPVCYVFGRSDGTVSLDGANIYIQDIQNVFESQEWEKVFNLDFNNILNEFKSASNKLVLEKLNIKPKFKGKIADLRKMFSSFKIGEKDGHLYIVLKLKDSNKIGNKEKLLYEKILYKIFVILLYRYSSGYKDIFDENLKSSDLIIEILEPFSEVFSKDSLIKIKYKL